MYNLFFFFFQAEDGIRDWSVTGVQTCALPIAGRACEATPARFHWRIRRLRPLSPNRNEIGARPMERMAFRAQTIVADVVIAAAAFALAYVVSPVNLPTFRPDGLPALGFAQLTLLYAA